MKMKFKNRRTYETFGIIKDPLVGPALRLPESFHGAGPIRGFPLFTPAESNGSSTKISDHASAARLVSPSPEIPGENGKTMSSVTSSDLPLGRGYSFKTDHPCPTPRPLLREDRFLI